MWKDYSLCIWNGGCGQSHNSSLSCPWTPLIRIFPAHSLSSFLHVSAGPAIRLFKDSHRSDPESLWGGRSICFFFFFEVNDKLDLYGLTLDLRPFGWASVFFCGEVAGEWGGAPFNFHLLQDKNVFFVSHPWLSWRVLLSEGHEDAFTGRVALYRVETVTQAQ